jgi:SAM-dependent methyltransferase
MRKLVLTFVPHRYRDVIRGAVFVVLSRVMVGDNVECPVCGRTSRRWVSLGFPEQVCPHCSAFSRQRMLVLYLARELGLGDQPLTMLHFAPEACLMRYFTRTPQLEYVGADVDPPKGAVKMDITDISLDSGSVDVVICSHVLEHVEDDSKAMREMKRVLAPGGTALILGPAEYDRPQTYEDPSIVTPSARMAAFGQSDHVRVYGADFDDRLRAAGFDLDADRYARKLSLADRTRFGLNPDEILYVCT